MSTQRHMRVREIFIALLTLDGWAQRARSPRLVDGQRRLGRPPLPDLRAAEEAPDEADEHNLEQGSPRRG